MIDILKIAKEVPGLIISLSAGDLVEAITRLIAEVRNQLEEDITKKEMVTYLSREMVMRKLNVTSTTLWRWAQKGYLVPINVGGQRRYRSTDIDEILNGER